MVNVVVTGAQDAKVRTVECLQCVLSVERWSVHRATVVRQTSMVSWSVLPLYMPVSVVLVQASF